ncbi:hypothetical protein Tco_1066696 [Tanacetum coccineum]|uniref:Transposase (putative) gypsy type domain-containing protein n=1 Tax=Tanacetum coccineum TaxID=301880 RepID=A0ABQ5HBM4_9ASTR
MHERPAGKIGLYTRFFDFANFRLPLSTFLVDVLRYFRINISQLSVIRAAKVFHFEILCRVCGITPTVGLFRCFYVNSKKNGWMPFIKRSEKSPHTAKNVTRDPALKATDFSAQDYAILVDHHSSFPKFPKEFLCLVGLSRHYTLDEETYPSFVDKDGEDMDIFAFIRTPNPTKVKVVERERHEGEPRLLVEQGDSSGGGDGRDTDVQLVATAADTISEDVVPLQPRHHKKIKTAVVDTGGPSHPPKKLKEDYETLGGPSVVGKSRFAVQRLLVGAVLNVEVRGEPIPALPLVTSSVSTTPECEEGDHIDSVTGLNLRTISAPQRLVISSDSSHHSGANIAEAEEKTVEPSVFAVDSFSASGDPNAGVFSDLTGSDFLVSSIRTVIDPESDLQKLFTEFNIGAARQVSLSAEERMRAEYNIKEKRKLKTVVDEQADLLKASSFAATEKSLWDEVNTLNGCNLILEKERDALDAKVTDLETVIVHELETSSARLQEKVITYENFMEQLGKFQDERMKVVSEKLEKLDTDLVEMALHLEEKFYPHLLTVIADRRWLLTYGMEFATVKCLHSPEYLSALEETISKAIEKGMQDGLAAGITHGQEGRVLTDVAAYNPSGEADYISALQQLQSLNFSLLAELGLTGSQPHVDQLMVPIHHSLDHRVVGASALSLSLDPLSITALTGTEGTSEVMPVTTAITTALSVTSASTSFIYPISTDDYEVALAAGQEGVGADADPFPDVDDAELNIQ